MSAGEERRGELLSMEEACARLAAGQFSFVDAGCSAGGSLEYCERVFRRGRGIGFDLAAEKITRAQAAGFAVCQADLASIELPARAVEFASLLDFLEHLPDLAAARLILARMAHVARDFLFVRHPSFEDVDYLASLGLKLTWTHWSGHKNPMRLSDFERIAEGLGLGRPTVLAQKPIEDSMHPAILPIDAPINTMSYDPERHGPKPQVRFDRPVYSQFDLFLAVNRGLNANEWFRITQRVVSPGSGTCRI